MGTDLVVLPPQQPQALATRGVVSAADLMPVLDIALARKRRDFMLEVTRDLMVKDVDYGIIPGTPKPTLLKPGAERLCSLFGFTPAFIEDNVIEDWTGADHGGEPLFHYRYRCQISKNGITFGEGLGSCSTWESKYRYRWLPEEQIPAGLDKAKLVQRGGLRKMFEPAWALDRRETTGKYGKPETYWALFDAAIEAGTAEKGSKQMGGKEHFGYYIQVNELQYRVPNPDIMDQVNTALKMAQKRAFIAAVLIATNASEFYTQDLEDLHPLDTAPAETPEQVRERRLAEERAKAEAAGVDTKTDTKPEPKPAPKPGPVQQAMSNATAAAQESDELKSMIKRACNLGGIQEVLGELGDRMAAVVGEAQANAEFDELYKRKNVPNWQALLKSTTLAREFIRLTFARIEELAEAGKPKPEEIKSGPAPAPVETPAAASTPAAAKGDPMEITDEDLPPIMRGAK